MNVFAAVKYGSASLKILSNRPPLSLLPPQDPLLLPLILLISSNSSGPRQCYTKKRIPTNSIFTTVSRTITTTTNKLNEKCNQTSDASDTLLKKIGSCFKDFATCLPCFNNLLCFTNTINDTFYCINDLKNIIKKFLNLTDNTVDSCLNT